MNSKGGRIYIGINDNKIVKGIQLTYKELDEIRNSLINYTNEFFPKCRTSKINIMFIPIKNKSNQFIKNLYIIKIIVHQGDTDQLYSTIERGGFISFIRLSGQCINLSAHEIRDEIINRNKCPEKSINKNEFMDPQPENPNLIQYSKNINELNNRINNLSISNYNNNYKSVNNIKLRINNIEKKNIYNLPGFSEEEEEEDEDEEDEYNEDDYEEENENDDNEEEESNENKFPEKKIICISNYKIKKKIIDENYVIKISTFGEIASVQTLRSLFNNTPNCRKKFLKRHGKVHGFLNFKNYIDAVKLINLYKNNLDYYNKFGVKLTLKNN